ncbi:MAG: class I SAM-dependent methyltransferase [Sphingopyxis sp.]|uniref:class I SAM-dependent methyltransferase n=1 Tax=Sphingopyxis sp. TaxID=1908224 RepID=UPI002ABB7E9D|nr:class I SAM-dependent methyltransferase [Sphingopyxis sp.]MDZ3833770.1 class I SAM-dependent methyltransferase [Sphingopyxis sp.]
MTEGAQHFLDSFNDPDAVARYTDGPRRFVPGLDGLHRMTGLLLAEHVPVDGQVLVLGAGGGAELKAMAEAHAGWRFTGVDPAGPMLDLAARVLGANAHRADLIEGVIDDAPRGPFDGATCLLTLHFLPTEERIRTAAEIRARLKPGAPFVAAHGSFPQGAGQRERWLDRYAAFAIASGGDPAQVAKGRAAVAAHVAMLSPEEDEDVLRRAGFTGIEQFYAAFTWRGWVGYA